MKFIVEPQGPSSTAYHPYSKGGNPLDDLANYLIFDFDGDRVLGVPKNSVVALSASNLRCSYITNRSPSRITLDLQPAVDVARMVSHYWKSEVWPARVVFNLFVVLSETCHGCKLYRAAEFVEEFCERRLVQLISDSPVGIPDRLPSWFSSRAQMFGSLDERALVGQLAAFQIFHEVGHLVESRLAARRGQKFSAEVEEDELKCDDFACGELSLAYGDSLGIEFLESSAISIVLSILIWTLAQHLRRLDNAEFRARTFATLLRRSRAATLRVYFLGRRTEPPSERSDSNALLYFPLFEAILRILDTFFDQAVSADSEIFDFHGSSPDLGINVPKTAVAQRPGRMPTAQTPWEIIWAEEDEAAEKKAELFRSQHEPERGHPRSRPLLR